MKRRNFLRKSGLGMAGLPFISYAGTHPDNKQGLNVPFKLGVASYSFRNYSLDDTLTMIKRLGLNRIALKSMHLPLETPPEEIRKIAASVRERGVELYGGGVIYMSTEQQVDQAFNYAQAAGMEVIIGVPDHPLLGYVEKKVQSTGIKVAIHNHGPGDEKYPSPDSIYQKIKNLDPKLGICLDIGHTARIGLDPSVEAKKFKDRLLDVHIKDVTAATEAGDTIEIGKGVIHIPSFLDTMIGINFNGTVSFEFEKDPDDIMPGFAESVGFVYGSLATLVNK